MALLLRDGCVLSMDPHIGDLGRGSVLVKGGKISAVGRDIDAPDNVEIVDASDLIVLPGFIDTHRHTWQSALRHRMGDLDFWTYCVDMLRDIGGAFRPEDVHVGTKLGAVAALDAGTTTLVDWSHVQNTPAHADAAIAGLREAGIRALFAHGWPRTESERWVRNSVEPHPRDIIRIRRDVLDDDASLVTLAMAARGPEMTTIDVTRQDIELARELGITITMHAGIRDLGPQYRAIAAMNEAGLLGSDLTLIHVCASSNEELRMMADNGVKASVGPQTEQTMNLLGVLAVGRLLAAGIRPSLSGDTEVCGSGDLFTQMRFCLGGERHLANNRLIEDETPALTVRDVLEFATVDGAEACGLGGRVGSLTPGKDADIICIRRSALNLTPVSDAVGAVVLGAHPGNVDTVIVGGRIVKRKGHLTGIDIEGLARDASESRDYLLRAVGKQVQPA